MKKTVGLVTTTYLVDTQNPTGYAQVVYETWSGGSGNRELNHTYVYGLERISQFRSYQANNQGLTQTSYYVYDGHGSTRALTDPTGNVTDTYDYDAFGNLLHSTGSTFNEFLFAGEQFDSDLGLYYNRARYLNVSTGRFWTMDPAEGDNRDPLSLHKYLYAEGGPIDHGDPTGNQIDDLVGSIAVDLTLNALSTIQLPGGSVSSLIASQLIPGDVLKTLEQLTPDAAEVGVSGQVSLNLNNPFLGATGFGGIELLGSLKTGKAALYGVYGAGLVGGSTASGGGISGNVGLVFNCPNSSDYTQNFVSITVPQGALSSQVRTKIQTEITQVDIASIEGGIPTGYASLLVALSSISVTGFSADKGGWPTD